MFTLSEITNKELDVKVAGNNAQEPFSGEQNTTHTFEQPQNGIVVSNDGASSIFVKVNKYVFEVKAGEVFQETFYPFTEVQITSSGVPFRAYGKSVGGVGLFIVEPEYFIPPTNTTVAGTNATAYKGSEFTMLKDQKLHYVAHNGDVATWQIWEVVGNNLSTLVSSGTYNPEKDGEGYAISNLDTPLVLTKGKKYILISKHNSGNYQFVWNGTITTMQPNVAFPRNTASMTITGRSFQSATAAQGTALSGSDYVYDIKLGLEG
jgi:hypothetical protein